MTTNSLIVQQGSRLSTRFALINSSSSRLSIQSSYLQEEEEVPLFTTHSFVHITKTNKVSFVSRGPNRKKVKKYGFTREKYNVRKVLVNK